MKARKRFYIAFAAVTFLLLVGTGRFRSVEACYGPHITANIDKTEVYINESVIITGQICPPEPNVTVRVAFTRPDYTWIDRYIQSDPETGEFTIIQSLDMVGYWNIFPIYGHLSDRLHANVTDPANLQATLPTPELPPYKPNVPLITAAAISNQYWTSSCYDGKKKAN